MNNGNIDAVKKQFTFTKRQTLTYALHRQSLI